MAKSLIEELIIDPSEIDKNNLDLAAKQLWGKMEQNIKGYNLDDQTLIQLAFEEMVRAHNTQKRKSGDFYIIHPVSAAKILTEINIDAPTLAACLMHDVPEDTNVSLDDLSKKFDPEIIFLIQGVTKLSVIKYQGVERYVENLRKMFVAMSEDLRVVFIKIADRLHNLATLKHVREDKQTRIALESLEIYVPIAERLGIGFLKGELQDLSFRYVYPEEYKKIISISDLEINKRFKSLAKIEKKVKKIFAENNIRYINLSGRAKKYYSIFKKIQKGKNLENIYDLIALRVIVDDIENCYKTLGILHSYFEPLTDRVKDYITQPKSNGYQSLHTSVKDNHTGTIFEFQIRTKEMHEYAEYGWASHWSYKQGGQQNKFLDPKNLKWISELVDLGTEDLSQEDYLTKVKLDLFEDRIFVLTPKGDVINLPKLGTPLDFAFHIHEDIGMKAIIAKVNGKIVKLSDPLTNGDVIEIETSKNQHPKKEWLDWAKSRHARRHIRSYLNKQGIPFKTRGNQ